MRMALATTQKGSSTVAEYFSKMKALAYDMAFAGKRLEDEEVASYILSGARHRVQYSRLSDHG